MLAEVDCFCWGSAAAAAAVGFRLGDFEFRSGEPFGEDLLVVDAAVAPPADADDDALGEDLAFFGVMNSKTEKGIFHMKTIHDVTLLLLLLLITLLLLGHFFAHHVSPKVGLNSRRRKGISI